jgi:uncharacterized heparinase superfamily protein
MHSLRLFYHTLRHLRVGQIVRRVHRAVRWRSAPDLSPAPSCRTLTGTWSTPGRRPPSLAPGWCFRFLNQERKIVERDDWNRKEWSALWLYNLHYFDDLNAEGALGRADVHQAWLERWVRENPPARGAGWDPYPVSLRSVNWVKWMLAGNLPPAGVVQSLAVQLRHLHRNVEWHVLGNHLISNAKALVFGGVFFEGPEAARWLRTGLSILEREIPEQILPDGGHFERSPMYHSLILEDLLDLVQLSSLWKIPSAVEWRDRVVDMLEWLGIMTHPDGEIVLFNDAAFGIALPPAVLTAYAKTLGFDTRVIPAAPLAVLPHTGYVRSSLGPAVLVADVAPIGPRYQPGHGHADALSFELSVRGNRLIVDTGTFCYGADPVVRASDRSTHAHNTVMVDGVNSSEVWSSFRVGRRAEITHFRQGKNGDEVWVGAAHTGYCRLRRVGLVRRDWIMSPSSLSIRDSVDGAGHHSVEVPFHFHPSVRLRHEAKGRISIILGESDERVGVLTVGNGLSPTIEDFWWHPEFGVAIRGSAVRCRWEGCLPYKFEMTFVWR